MRVLMLSERWFPMVGGGEYHIQNLARELIDLGCEITLIARSLRGKEGVTKPFYEMQGGKFKVYRLPPTTSFTNPIGRISYTPMAVLKALSLKDEFDVIHSQSFAAGIPALLLKHMLKIPVVHTVHGIYQAQWSDLISSKSKAALFKKIERFILFRDYDATITVDKYFISVAKKLGYFKRNIIYIPNGVDCERFESAKKKNEKYTFLFLGRLVEQKGLKYLIRAAKILKEENFQILLAGTGPQEKMLKELTAQSGLKERIKFLGYIHEEELTRLYLRSDAFVLPSIWEGLPLTLLEAWAARLPVIATNVGGIGDVCINEENALVIPSKNPQKLAEAMKLLIDNEPLEKKLAVNGRRLVEKEYSWKIIAKRTLDVYKNLVER